MQCDSDTTSDTLQKNNFNTGIDGVVPFKLNLLHL